MRFHSNASIIQIQGRRLDIRLARIKYLCIHCLSGLRRRDAGLVCIANENHYGFIHKSEAEKLTTEERFMKIGEMFPSDYLRGIDVHQPMLVEIVAVKEESAVNRETGEVEPEYVVYFKGLKKKLRLNITMAREVISIFEEDDTDRWVGKKVTIYRTKIKAFGKKHIVARIRKPKPGDKPSVKIEKDLKQLTRAEFWDKVKSELKIDPAIVGYIVTAAGLTNGDGYQPDKAPEMWTEIKTIGPDLQKLIKEVLANISYYDDTKAVLEAIKYLDLSYTPDQHLDIFNALAEHANAKADEAAAIQENLLI